MWIETTKILTKVKYNLPDANQESVSEIAYLQWHCSSFF